MPSDPNVSSPAALSYRAPAEWERHEATWLVSPQNHRDWPGKFSPIPWIYAEIVRHLVPGEHVRILISTAALEQKARRILSRAGVDLSRVEFFHLPTNRGWIRDSGPIILKRSTPEPRLALARFAFNAWAKYGDWQLDQLVPDFFARQFGYEIYPAQHGERLMVLEGGAIDTNGQGTLLTTEECLLDPKVQTRNPGWSAGETESMLEAFLGVSQVIWLGRGIAGDDTHGHVDDLCRFVNPTTVVLCREDDPADANYRVLHENFERLQGVRLANGALLEVVPLPMPHPLVFDRRRLPASYANFYIANAAVLVPTFNDPLDRLALGLFAELFPDRPVIGIYAVDLVWGLGTLHCLTREHPALE